MFKVINNFFSSRLVIVCAMVSSIAVGSLDIPCRYGIETPKTFDNFAKCRFWALGYCSHKGLLIDV